MQNRKRNVSCCTRSVRRKLGASTGERSIAVDKKERKRNLATAPLIYVEWVDAVSDGGWEDNIKVDIHPVKTVGFLVSESKDGICLASTVSGESTNARMHIPKAWITKRKVIKIENSISKKQRKSSTAVGKRPVTEATPGTEFG